ncbi:hypothetical protein WG907_17240 [Sphingobium sp. AN558]|uniref:hypothetical protein n=1 Tax=Sphingobium sp. AN558 TaxID=3133442 RepID=UPI0030C1F20E
MNAIPTVTLKQRIGIPVFILGFPFGRLGVGMPVWKQGALASEPFLAPLLDHRLLIVDTASRPGMSGSPVIQRVHGQVELAGGYGRNASGDGACNFIGIYSGRFHTNDGSDAQLGRVWPAILVEEGADRAWPMNVHLLYRTDIPSVIFDRLPLPSTFDRTAFVLPTRLSDDGETGGLLGFRFDLPKFDRGKGSLPIAQVIFPRRYVVDRRIIVIAACVRAATDI